jgi:arachidonate 15-lipoxygenase
LHAVQIQCPLGTVRPGETNWALAVRIAICAATTNTALVRHWTWTHLIGGECFAAAARNCLPAAHPLGRLLWPHMVGTHASNRLATLGQLVPAGDFEHIYSLPYAELCRLVSKARHDFNLRVCDPDADARSRGILDAPVQLETLANCRDIFDILFRHAGRYLKVYYTDDELRRDRAVRNWLEELDRLLENELGLGPEPLTCETVARVIARLIYLVTVHHEQVGTHLWNYQLWSHTHPVRVYEDGRRMPEDVYQRVVNSNYILNVVRAPLLQDYAGLVLPDPDRPDRRQRAEDVFRRFSEELQKLQRSMEREPWACWKLYPADLEANINA